MAHAYTNKKDSNKDTTAAGQQDSLCDWMMDMRDTVPTATVGRVLPQSKRYVRDSGKKWNKLSARV